MSLVTSDELNFLVYRYLQESGFTHAAFVFGYESFVHKSGINGSDVPPGALVSFVQKGLHYLELEANLNEELSHVDGDFTNLTSNDLITKDVQELRQLVLERREAAEEARLIKATPEQLLASAAPQPQEIPKSSVLNLEGHDSEVFICAWSPSGTLLASGSGDSTARIWDLTNASEGNVRPIVLPHISQTDDKSDKSKDVTTLDWNWDGSLLATGSYDGIARIWSKTGEMKQMCSCHTGPIFSLKWNKKGDLLLSGSVDKSAIVWDGKTGEVKQQFDFHTAPTLDVDWRNNHTFATCSTDKNIFVCKLGEAAPLKVFQGHQDEVNAIKWDPSGKYLASCSDDRTAKVWTLNSDECLHDFKEHTKEIYTIKWSPVAPAAGSSQKQLLVTASFDSSIKLWDIESGSCLYTLTNHTQPVYSVSFSPNGEYLASGSFDKNLLIWNVKDGRLLKYYKGLGGIFELCWHKDGDKVAACFSNKIVSVLDVKM